MAIIGSRYGARLEASEADLNDDSIAMVQTAQFEGERMVPGPYYLDVDDAKRLRDILTEAIENHEE